MADLINPFLSSIVIREYEGETENSLCHGQGKAVFQSNAIYEGSFSNGLMHGKGLYRWQNGVSYEGDFHQNSIEGTGTYKWQVVIMLI